MIFDASVLELPFTGIAKTSLLLYRECIAQRPGLVITGLHRKPLAGATPPGIRLLRCGRFLSRRRWNSYSFSRQVKRGGAGVVHFPWNGGVPDNLRARLIATTIHDVLPLEIPNCFKNTGEELSYRLEMQATIDRSDIIFTDSEYSKKQIMSHFQVKTEPIVNYLGPTLEDVPQEAGASSYEKNKYLLYLGGYDRRKGIVELLEVFLELYRNRQLDCKLLLVGKVQHLSDEFRNMMREGTQIGAVRELGYVPDETLTGLLRYALALVYPSRFEGFGLPPLEAMRFGCPVITTAFTSIPEICGDAALYIDPWEKKGFGEGIISVLNSESMRFDLRERGLKQAARFSWKKTAETFLAQIDHHSIEEAKV